MTYYTPRSVIQNSLGIEINCYKSNELDLLWDRLTEQQKGLVIFYLEDLEYSELYIEEITQ